MGSIDISNELYNELEELSNSQIDELAKILGIGFFNENIDKEDKIIEDKC